MQAWGPTAAGVFGLLIGSFLNVVIWRVPRGESLLPDSHCPKCDAKIRPWHNVPVISWIALRGRCANCGTRISARYPLVEIATGAAFALVAGWVFSVVGATTPFGAAGALSAIAAWLVLAAYLWLAAISIALTLIDLEHKRLPDAIVVPSIAVVTALLGVAAALSGNWSQFVSALAGAAILFVAYFLIVLVYPRGLGGGDVKLAPVLGAALGFVGWDALAVGAFAGFVLGAVYGLALIAMRRGGRKTEIPFGPFMLAGAWVGVWAGPAVMHAYLSLWALG
ncbi:prepilin peptidase [Leucobacter sp. W1038]|uniref:prepilin peptidase n=1 Tax=Leucobacter sp. W1038 TaxID=3438281 RepID=UPI003D960AF5